ncbi:unnamed protein product, partial [Iphiclides podalirius]
MPSVRRTGRNIRSNDSSGVRAARARARARAFPSLVVCAATVTSGVAVVKLKEKPQIVFEQLDLLQLRWMPRRSLRLHRVCIEQTEPLATSDGEVAYFACGAAHPPYGALQFFFFFKFVNIP